MATTARLVLELRANIRRLSERSLKRALDIAEANLALQEFESALKTWKREYDTAVFRNAFVASELRDLRARLKQEIALAVLRKERPDLF